MEFIVLDLTTATEEQIKAAIECNNRTSRLMQTEIDKLKSVAETLQQSKRTVVLKVQPDNTEEQRTIIDSEFEKEVEYYYEQLKELTLENIEEEIETTLPSKKHYQYERILNRLKLESIRTIKEIKELLIEEGLLGEEITAFQDEYNLELKKIQLINKLLCHQMEDEISEKPHENKLIFVPTLGGGIRVLDEIDSIPIEYYDRFYGLFRSIKDGTFKNVQRFDSNSSLAGLSEVKDFKVRVLFVRLNSDSYAVISAFTKKTDNDKAYRTATIKKYSDYKTIETRLIENLSNPEFMQLQQEYETELFRKLSPSDKITPVVKSKGGDTE